MSDKEFIILIQKYIPVRCRSDEGCDFDLKKVHHLINEYLETDKI